MKRSICLQTILFLGSIITQPVAAQITPDGTTSTTVIPTATGVEINNGDAAGGNLFHSFDELSVPTGREAFFNNADNISNIFSRVTGGNISNIDGILRANGAANLFLINPAGILFGEGARLQLGGSFYGSTADSIVFPDGEFSATDLDNPPLITINAPIGLGFRDNPGDITVRGNGNGVRRQEIPVEEDGTTRIETEFNDTVFDTQEALRVGTEVDTDKTIGLIGGNLIFEDATVKTAGSRIELGSVAGGEVNLVEVAEGFTFDYSAIDNFRDISLTGKSSVDASGDGGGAINVAGNNIFLSDLSELTSFTLGSTAGEGITIGSEQSPVESLSVTDGAQIKTDTFGRGDGGNLAIFANDIKFDRADRGSVVKLSTEVQEDASGNGGNITIGSEQSPVSEFRLLNSARISVGTRGQGNGGDFKIFANLIEVNGRGGEVARLNADVGQEATGKGGNIFIGSEQSPVSTLRVVDGARISVSIRGQGDGGNLTIFANNIEIDSSGSEKQTSLSAQALNDSTGNGGIINIGSEQSPVTTLNITNGGAIFLNTGGEGDGGNLNIFANNIKLDRGKSTFDFNIGLNAEAQSENIKNTGNSGNITIGSEQSLVENLEISNGAGISVTTFSEGDAGNLKIFANNIELDRGESEFRTALTADVLREAEGKGGNITIGSEQNPVKTLSIINGAEISANTGGQGNAGDLTLNVSELNLSNESRISVNNFVFTNIKISPTAIEFVDSDVAIFGGGNTGDIKITADNINLQNESEITASSASGEGGNIILDIADNLTLRNNSLISAQAREEASGGNLTIDTDFIIAYPSNGNGSDISASSEQKQGGEINIKAEALLNIEERKAIPNNGTNDIDATSGIEGLDGTVSIDSPETNSFRETTETVDEIVTQEIVSVSDTCAAKDIDDTSGLVIEGKGGVPPEPTEPFEGLAIIDEEDIKSQPEPDEETETTNNYNPGYIPPHIKPVLYDNGEPLYAARGIIIKPDGGFILTAYPTPGTPGYREYQEQMGCDLN